MDEFALINEIKQTHYKQSSLVKGIGDDSAVFRQSYKDTVTAVDTFVENVHFSRATMNDEQIGYRSLAATVSDLAAMGAEPVFYLVSIVIPNEWETTSIQNIFLGMDHFASKYKMDLIGGDTVSGKELTLSITVVGYALSHRIRYRHTAKAKDIVFVTGSLGDSQAGLYILQNNISCTAQKYFIERHQRPSPKVNFAKALGPIKRVTLNDISDGLASELNEIATASNINIIIDEQKVPIHRDLYQFDEKQYKQWAYYGGEDFELVGTVATSDWNTVQTIATETNTEVTAIGSVERSTDERHERVFMKTEKDFQVLPKLGYIHLK